MATIIRLDHQITDVSAPRVLITLTSDDFSQTGEIVGSMTSAALGGAPMQWGGIEGGWIRENGGIRAQDAPTNRNIELRPLPQDISVRFTAVTIPTNGRIIISLRSSEDASTRASLRLEAGGVLRFENRVNDAIELSNTVNAVNAGDRVQIMAEGDSLKALVNGVSVLSFTTSITGPGGVRLSAYRESTAVIDDLKIEQI